MYGPVSMDIAQHWPVLTSYDHLLMYAQSKGGRLPTEPELRLFLDTYDVGFEGGANIGFRNWHPVPSVTLFFFSTARFLAQRLFHNRATTGLEEYAGRGSNGGVWEWTSTLFDNHEGLSPTNLFTGFVLHDLSLTLLTSIFPGTQLISSIRSIRLWYVFLLLLPTFVWHLLSIFSLVGSIIRDHSPSCRPTDTQKLLSAQLPVPLGWWSCCV